MHSPQERKKELASSNINLYLCSKKYVGSVVGALYNPRSTSGLKFSVRDWDSPETSYALYFLFPYNPVYV